MKSFILIVVLRLVYGAVIESPTESELTISVNATITLICKGDHPLNWTHPVYDPEIVIPESNVTVNEEFVNGTYVSKLTLRDAEYIDTGFYTCKEITDVPDTEDTTYPSVYIYVFDTEHLLVDIGLPEELTVDGFGDVLIPCRPTSPSVNVTLIHESGEEMTNVSFDSKTGFLLKSPEVADSGSVTCLARYGDFSKETAFRMTIDPTEVSVSPPVIDAAGSYHTVIGGTTVLNCSVTSEVGTIVYISWTLPNKKAKNNTIIGNHSSVNTQDGRIVTYKTATIRNSTYENEGEYKCKAMYAKSEMVATYYLRVFDANTSFMQIEVPFNIYKTTIAYGKERHLLWIVNITAFPRPDVKWIDPLGSEIPSGLSNKKINLNFNGRLAKLEILDVTVYDSGVYTLIASNKNHSESIRLELLVEEAPIVNIGNHIKDSTEIYEYGKNYSIDCTAVGYPLPKIIWYKRKCGEPPPPLQCVDEESQIPEDKYEELSLNSTYELKSTLRFTAIEPYLFSCVAINMFNQTNDTKLVLVSDVENNFAISQKPDIVSVGDNIELSCDTSIYEFEENTTWLYEDSRGNTYLGRKVKGASWIVDTTSLSHHSTLKINNVSKEHSGTYTCLVAPLNKTSYLQTQKSLTIIVRDVEKPSIIGNLTKNGTGGWHLPMGKKISWNCTAEGVPPPTVSWYKDGLPLVTPNDNRVKLIDNNRTLLIKFTALSDEAIYACVATNKVGNASLSTRLFLTDKPKDHEHMTFFLLVSILAMLCVIFLIWLLIKIKKEHKMRKDLAATGLLYFEKGHVDSLNPEIGIEDQADLLPYDRRWEFPREKLKFGKQLGSGAFGVVLKAEAEGIIDENINTTVAVKMVKRGADPLYIRALASELKIMIHLGRHLNVVNLLGACTKDIMKRELVVIVEYCRFGNLHDFLLKQRSNFVNQINEETGEIDFTISDFNRNYYTPMQSQNGANQNVNSGDTLIGDDGYLVSKDTEPDWQLNYRGDYKNATVKPIKTADLICWSFQIARGMEYLANRKVLHGDLAARNVLLSDDNIVKICDFGLAKSMYNNENYQRKKQDLLPVRWMAIESIRDRIFSSQSDVWSFGITMWELFSLSVTPYPGIEHLEVLYNKLVSGHRLEQPTYASKQLHNVMLDCWHDRPMLRPTFSELCERLGAMLEDGVRSHYTNMNDMYLKMNADMVNNVDYLSFLNPPTYIGVEEPRYVNVSSISRESPEPEENHELRPMLENADERPNPNPIIFYNPAYADLSRPKKPTYENTRVISTLV